MNTLHKVKLAALDGSNLLAFMAALGTLRLLNLNSNASLKWVENEGVWMPMLISQLEQNEVIPKLLEYSKYLSNRNKYQSKLDRLNTFESKLKALLAVIKKQKQKDKEKKINERIKKSTECRQKLLAYKWLSQFPDLNLTPEQFRQYAQQGQQSASLANRAWADYASAFGSEAIWEKKENIIKDTAFRTMQGAGHQHFIGFMSDLCSQVESEALHEALFDGWKYDKQCPSLRWDGIEHRRYALRANDPASDQTYKVPGANRLAFEALPLFPCMPVGPHLQTTGFSRLNKTVTISWPIWEDALGLDEIRSLLSSQHLQKETPDKKMLTALGVKQIYRSRRISEGKYRNFSPSTPLL